MHRQNLRTIFGLFMVVLSVAVFYLSTNNQEADLKAESISSKKDEVSGVEPQGGEQNSATNRVGKTPLAEGNGKEAMGDGRLAFERVHAEKSSERPGRFLNEFRELGQKIKEKENFLNSISALIENEPEGWGDSSSIPSEWREQCYLVFEHEVEELNTVRERLPKSLIVPYARALDRGILACGVGEDRTRAFRGEIYKISNDGSAEN